MAYISRLIKKKLGEILVESGLLKEEQVKQALAKQKETGELLGELLVKLSFVKEEDIAYALAKQFGLPYIDASRYMIDGDFAQIIDPALMHKNKFVILDKIGKFLIIAISGVIDIDLITELEKKSGCQVFIYVSTVSEITEALKNKYKIGETK